MAIALAALDVHYLVDELKASLIDAFVDKVYQGKDEKGDFLFKLRSPTKGKQQLYIKVPDALFLTEHRFSWPQNPPGFCMQLRKHLVNAKITDIKQQGFERIVIITFQKGEVSWRLIIELFSKGNVVLVNDEGLIRGVLDLQRWKDRTLRVNAPYELPPVRDDVQALSSEALQEKFASAGQELVKFLATGLGFGGRYAEEVVARTGLDKHATVLAPQALDTVHRVIGELFSQEPKPLMLAAGPAPFMLETLSGEPAASFSAAVESFVITEKIEAIDAETELVGTKKTGKHQRIIDEQSMKLEGYERAAEENQAKGEWLYAHYQEVSSLLAAMQQAHASGGWSAVDALIKEQGLPVKTDAKKGTVTFEAK